MRSSPFRISVIRAATIPANPSPTASVTSARPASRRRRSTSAVHVAVTGNVSGLMAIAPTMRMLLA
jgi:hypothetical protein